MAITLSGHPFPAGDTWEWDGNRGGSDADAVDRRAGAWRLSRLAWVAASWQAGRRVTW